MFNSTIKKLAGLGLALCMAGTLVLAAPVTVTAADGDITPLTIVDPYYDGEDD